MSEFPPPAELQTGPSLSKDDLVSIVKNSLGLRHDTSETQPHLLEDDQPKDALALASLVGLLPQEVLNTVPNYSDPTWKAFYQGRADYLINLLTPPQIELLSSLFIEKVSEFISNWTTNTQTSHHFSLLTNMRGSDRGYETSHYYGLGKCGLQTISPDQLFASDSFPDSQSAISWLITQIKSISQTKVSDTKSYP